MADINFTIPGDRAELLSDLSSNYTVKNVVIPGEIVQKLDEAYSMLRDEGPDFIIEYFDTYYSVLHHADKLKPDVVFKAFKHLHRATGELDKSIGFLLDDKDSLSVELNAKIVTVLKMLIYIYIQFVLHLEQMKRKNQDDLGGRNKKQKAKEDYFVDKLDVLKLLCTMIQREINLFWEPPVVEHDFVAMLAELCYSFLQNPTIKAEKEARSAIFGIFGHLIKSYDYGRTFVTRLVQSIRMYEHVVQCVPEGVQFVVETFKCPSLVHHFVKEATEWQVDEAFQDNQATRWCSLFLTELAVLLPKLMIPEVMYLNQYLSYDSPPLRISILNVITEVILKILTKHDLSEEEKESRDEFFEILVEHMRDVSALVRVRVIQNLARLQKANATPLNLQNEILEDVMEHLMDKAAAVRKAAINCITTFLQHNPFGANLQLKKTEEELARKIELLDRMEASYKEEKANKIKVLEAEWLKIEEDVKVVIKQELELEEEVSEGENDEEAPPQINKDQAAELIRDHLNEKKYALAFKLCCRLKDDIDEWKNLRKLSEDHETQLYLMIMRSFFINPEKVIDELRTGAGMTVEDIEKIETIQKLIKYLENTVAFLKIIDSIFKPMKKLLFTQNISDMHEAINFFVTAYQFQIDNASEGVLEMLKLIKYNEPERREGVIEAFKTIYLTTDTRNMAEHTTTILNRLISLLKEITFDNFDDLMNIVSEWTSKGILDNSVIDKCWHYYTQREQVTVEDARLAADLLRMAAMGRRTIITKNVSVVTTVAFSDKCKDDMLFLASSCRLLAVVGMDKVDIQSKEAPFKVKHQDPLFQNLSTILIENFFKKVPYYSDASRAGFECIYRICAKPNAVCEKLVNEILNRLQESRKLAVLHIRLCQMLGHLATNTLEFLDNTVYRELKRRNFMREELKENKKNKNANGRKSKSRKSVANTTINDTGVNESVLAGAEAEDTDAEFILSVLENYVVSNCGFLGSHVDYLINICQRPDMYSNVLLQQSAVTALMRYMLVSSRFCRDNIRLLFTIFEKTTYPDITCTILIHCSDLLTRFPNIVEPWSPRIYEKLKDPLVKVRKTAFFALSNLILRDMIRAHSHISEMAACLIDENQEFASMCKSFFGRLARKENNLANVIPDIFSHLVKTNDVSEENLRFILKFLFDLVDNSKRAENLVDRFCCKYTPTEDLKLNRNITYCLSLINYNDKALKKLHEKFPLYKHHVHDPEIYGTLKQILAECSKPKVGKTDLKPIATDIENCINSVFEINEDGQPARAPPSLKKTKGKSRSNSNRKKASRKTSSGSNSDDDNVRGRKNKKTKGSNRKRTRTNSSSESD